MGAQLIFVLLQLADFATTMTAIGMGGVEQNPLVSRLMFIGTVQGLILSKVIVLALALAAIRARKDLALRSANVVFGAIVAWNVMIIARLVLRAHGAP